MSTMTVEQLSHNEAPTPPLEREQRTMDGWGDDDDGDMADLFSFDTGNDAPPEPAPTTATTSTSLPRTGSDDSLLNLLQESERLVESNKSAATSTATEPDDDATREILDWLDNDDDDSSSPNSTAEEKQQAEEESKKEPEEAVPAPAAPTVVSLPPQFTTLTEALESSSATLSQIKSLLTTDQITSENRAEIYCRLLNGGKSIADMQANSSLVDSFASSSMDQDDNDGNDDAQKKKLLYQTATARNVSLVDLGRLVRYADDKGTSPYFASVAATLLATGMPVAVAAVTMRPLCDQHVPPPMLLSPTSLFADWYRLASYHLPLLTYHLDRYHTGWADAYTNGDESSGRGLLPAAWLVALWGDVSLLSTDAVLAVWDQCLVRTDHDDDDDDDMKHTTDDLPFFLALQVLRSYAEELLLLTDTKLVERLRQVVTLSDDALRTNVQEWLEQANFLRSRTPRTVRRLLRTSTDRAIKATVRERQARMEAELQERLQQEAEAARERLTRARLVAFYRVHAPDKEANIETIMEAYKGRFVELDVKLKRKYGEGFNPPIAPQNQQQQQKQGSGLLASMSFGNRSRAVEKDESTSHDDQDGELMPTVSVTVAPSEVLPAICWSKEAAAKSHSQSPQNRRKNRQRRPPLKFYLVDSRSEEAAEEQGRFPTAANLSPEALLDPERIRQNEEMFESLRGAVHIVVMGEGFAALPSLYKQKVSDNLETLSREDESRTNMCALFFLKKGFPFVSVLDGGFAAAHSWLVREGPSHHLAASKVLVDYDPRVSLFGQMESFHNASAGEKAQRRMQSLLETSLVAMTQRAQQLERLSMEMEHKENNRGLNLARFGFKTTGSGEEKAAFRNPFAGLKTKSSTDGTEPVKKETDPSTTSSETVAQKSSMGVGTESSSSSPAESGVSSSATKPTTNVFAGAGNVFKGMGKAAPANNPLKGIGAAWNASVKGAANSLGNNKDSAGTAGTTKPMSNPFQGIGFKSASSTPAPTTEQSNDPKRGTNNNPFARFGGTATAGSFNNFRKSTLARMRKDNASAATNSTQSSSSDDEVAISFEASNSSDNSDSASASTRADIQKI